MAYKKAKLELEIFLTIGRGTLSKQKMDNS